MTPGARVGSAIDPGPVTCARSPLARGHVRPGGLARLGSGFAALLACALVLPPAAASAPAPARVLHARSATLDVRDGDRLLRGIWRADPTAALDRFDVRRSDRPKRVVFLSDVDSLAFDVSPGEQYEFVVVLASGDSCRTCVSARRGSARRVEAGADTIPFTVARGKIHVRGTIGDSRPLDLIFDTGADQCVLYPSGVRKGAVLHLDGSVENAGMGGTTRRRTSSDNRLAVEGLRWEHEPVLSVEKQADRGADGIVGYTVFEDKVLEIDFDRSVMVIHDSLPARTEGDSRVPMPAAGSLTAVDVELVSGGRSARGPFLLDTAGGGDLNVHSGFADAHGLRTWLRKLGTSRSYGLGARAIANDVLRVPELRIAGFTLRNVPIDVARPAEGGAATPAGTLNMDLLSRFHCVLDYPRGEAWFRPSRRFDAPFPRRAFPGTGVAEIAIVLMLVALIAYRRRFGPRSSAVTGATPER